MKNYILTLILTLFTFMSIGQYSSFSENMGGGTGTVQIASNTFQNGLPSYPIGTFTGTADTRITNPSTGYAGSSGVRNIFFTNYATGPTPSNRYFIISNINTTNLFGLSLSFGHFKFDTNSNNELIVEVSVDGTTYNPLSYSRPTGIGTGNTWVLITTTGLIPSTPNLRIRFRNSSPIPPLTPTTFQFRIDDIKLTYETALPIELISFEGSKKEDYNLLEWSTASEKDNDYFLIERSQDGINWVNINTTDGMGNSNTKVDYLFRDFTFSNDVNYYRMTQVDFNGIYETFDIISINNNKKQKQILKITNTFGQEVSQDTKGLLIITYTDGTSEKIIN
jgi:hypothetical protein